MVTPLAYFDLLETFPEPGCAICRLLLRDAERLLDSLLYERVNEPNSHRLFRAARGLCNDHAWQLTEFRGGALGIAILYHATVDEVLKILDHAPHETPRAFSRSRNATSLSDHLKPTENCMVCTLLSSTEQDYVSVFSRHIDDLKLQKAYEESDGLCLPHFRLILRESYPPDLLKKVIHIQKTIWEKLEADLAEFVDKNRHERMHETMGRERDSWQRAIRQMAGAKSVFGIEARPVK